MIDARTVALLVRDLKATSLDDAAALIETYARMVAAEAVTKATAEAYDHCLAVIEAPLSKENPDAARTS